MKSKTFKRTVARKDAGFANDMSASNLVVINEFASKSERNKDRMILVCRKLNIDISEPQPEIMIWADSFSALQDENPATPILINGEGIVAEVNEECTINEEVAFKIEGRKLMLA